MKQLIYKYQLWFVVLLQIGLLMPDLPKWVNIVGLVFWTLSLIPYYKTFKYLTYLTGLLSLFFPAYIIKDFHFVLSNELISSLLVVLTTLRLIEHNAQSKNPPYFIYLLGIFLSVTKFIFQIDFIFGIYAFIFILYYLYQFFPENFRLEKTKKSFLTLLSIILSAIPMTIILFIIFPRLQFQDHGDGQSNYGLFSSIGASGFSAELAPGSVSEVVIQNDLAFRAEIYKPNMTQNRLYWKGQILDRPQGIYWRRSSSQSSVEVDNLLSSDLPMSYKIILEPHVKEQLFTLYDTDLIETDEQKILYSKKNDSYFLPFNLQDKLVYYGYIDDAHVNTADDSTKTTNLIANGKPTKILSLIAELQKKSNKKLTPTEKVKLISKYYEDNHFQYSLKQLSTTIVTLDDFLFKAKVGFCEHYASATALILRYWNVPARVVVGYQGGEYNKAGGFWTITQKDAHAWIEYVNEKNQWEFYDPVVEVAPDRINLGAEAYFSSFLKKSFIEKYLGANTIFETLSNYLENFNYQWTLFFAEYSTTKLKNFLIKIYEENDDVKLATKLVAMLIGIFLVFQIFKKQLLEKVDLKTRFQRALTGHFKNLRLDQMDNESFSHWKNRILIKYQGREASIEALFNIYLANRYGENSSFQDYHRFKSLLKKIE